MKKIIVATIVGLALLAPTALAADNFSGNHSQGVFGKFEPVYDETVSFSVNQSQGVFGKFVPVFDEAAGAAAPAARRIIIIQ